MSSVNLLTPTQLIFRNFFNVPRHLLTRYQQANSSQWNQSYSLERDYAEIVGLAA